MTNKQIPMAVKSSSAVYVGKAHVPGQSKIIDHLRKTVYTVHHSAFNQ